MKETKYSHKYADSYLNSFSHIYMEEQAACFDEAKSIIRKIPKAKIITISNYKDVFNRPRQNFIIQKRSPKLILAKKNYDFIYKGSQLCEDFGFKNFYYCSCILNCIYNCEYCYLQGLYNSANIIVFVNIEDYFKQVDKLTRDKKVYLCLSYDSDMLALEGLTGFTRKWINYARYNKNLLIEIRTKSANFNLIEDMDIPENVIMAWTLSPREIVKKYELKAPSLNERIKSIKKAMSKGIRIRLSFEPIIMIQDYKIVYKKFIDEVFNCISPDMIRDINIGTFRMSKEHAKRINKIRKNSELFAYELSYKDNVVSYKREKDMKEFICSEILKYVNKAKVY